MDINMVNIGKRIKDRRNELNLTHNDIARECGIKSGALSQIEHGTRTPSAITFYTLSKVLDCSMEWLITGESNINSSCRFYEKEDRELNEMERRVQMLCKANQTTLDLLSKTIGIDISEVNLAVSGIIDSPMTLKKIAIYFGVDENYLKNGASAVDKSHLSEQMFLQLYRQLDNESKDKIISYLLFIANEKNL